MYVWYRKIDPHTNYKRASPVDTYINTTNVAILYLVWWPPYAETIEHIVIPSQNILKPNLVYLPSSNSNKCAAQLIRFFR